MTAAHLPDATAAAHRAARSDGAVALGRVGIASRGVLYVAIGLLALRLALGHSSGTTDKDGALAALARQPFGKVLLVVTAIGLVAYALWCLVKTLLVDEDAAPKRWAKRLGYLGRAGIYGAASGSAISILRDRPTGNDAAKQHGWSATVMGWPGGRVLMGAAGVALVAAAGWNVYRAVTRKFEEHLDTASMSSRARTIVRGLADAGLAGRAVAFAAVAWFVVQAAVDFNAAEPIGLDESLRALQAASYGPFVTVVVGLGLALFGAYSFAEARWRELPE
jgi:hypothetical protein